MSDFNLDSFIKNNMQKISSLWLEDYFSGRIKPKPQYLEDIGISPFSVLGEAGIKDYFRWKAHTPNLSGPSMEFSTFKNESILKLDSLVRPLGLGSMSPHKNEVKVKSVAPSITVRPNPKVRTG